MLPIFPKAQQILDDEWSKRMFAARTEVFPAAYHPPVRPIVEARSSDYQRDDGKINPLQLKRKTVSSQVDVSHGRGLTLELFDAKAKELGHAVGKQMFQGMLDAVNEAAKETGNTVAIKKGAITQADLLKIFDTPAESFDEQGNSNMTFVLNPELARELAEKELQWSRDPKFVAQITELKQRKRREFDEREARRRLVD